MPPSTQGRTDPGSVGTRAPIAVSVASVRVPPSELDVPPLVVPPCAECPWWCGGTGVEPVTVSFALTRPAEEDAVTV